MPSTRLTFYCSDPVSFSASLPMGFHWRAGDAEQTIVCYAADEARWPFLPLRLLPGDDLLEVIFPGGHSGKEVSQVPDDHPFTLHI